METEKDVFLRASKLTLKKLVQKNKRLLLQEKLREISKNTFGRLLLLLHCHGASKLSRPDEIYPKILQDGAGVTKPQCDPFNLSINLSTFPDKYKIPKINLFLEKGQRLIAKIRGSFTEQYTYKHKSILIVMTYFIGFNQV